MIKKILIILTILLYSFSLADEPIKAKVKYNEASARIEAFKDVERKIDKDFYKNYLKDKNKKENLEAISKKTYELDNRILCPFYVKSILLAYGVTYFDKFDTTFFISTLADCIMKTGSVSAGLSFKKFLIDLVHACLSSVFIFIFATPLAMLF